VPDVPDSSNLLTTLRDALAGRYAVERELGRGGMATVFLARDVKHRRPVAIKVLHQELAVALGADRFLREIEIAAALQHPHILPLFDSGRAGELLFYVMPYVEGESLRDRLAREKQLSLEDTVKITAEVASALTYAHSHGVVHRDIKPENIMLSGGSAVVADFGIARAISAADSQHLTETGTAIGTPAYMSPEQATGSGDVDGRSDQYSLACVTYEMLVGAPPFTGPTARAVMARHSLDTVSPPSIVRDTIPDGVEDAILRALSKVPADRFPTALLFAEALTAPSAVTGPRRRATRPTARPRRWLGMPPAVAAAVGIVVVIVGLFGVRGLRRGGRVAAGGDALDPRHIAVLYFEDLTPKKDLAYLGDGLTESLIAELKGVPSLAVISKNGVAKYRGSDVPTDSIARALNVGTLVQGSVEDAGDRYRVSVRLIDGASGVDFKRGSFAHPKGDLLKIRDTLAVRVADFLRQRLGEEVRVREERSGTENPAAWSLMRQAEKTQKNAGARVAAGDVAGAAQLYAHADSLLQAAEGLDPRWVDPVVLQARIAYLRAVLERAPPEMNKGLQIALMHAERAVAMDARNPDALEIRGAIRYQRFLRGFEPDAAAAEKLLGQARADLEDATKLNPNQVGAWTVLSSLYYQTRDRVGANRAARAAYESDVYLAGADAILHRLYLTSYDLELFQQANDWCNQGHRRFPGDARFVECQLILMSTTARDPDVAQAWRLVDEVTRLTPERDRPLKQLNEQIWVAAVLGRAGLKDSARHVLDRSRGSPDIDPTRDLLGLQAVVRTMLGDKDEALRLLGEYLVANPRHREGFRNVHWWWRPLQDDPRFKALIGAR
jgi:TolB-like protein